MDGAIVISNSADIMSIITIGLSIKYHIIYRLFNNFDCWVDDPLDDFDDDNLCKIVP